MSSLLESYIERGYDFGMAYAYLRCYWNHSNTIEDWWHMYEEDDRKRRRKVIVDNKITKRDMPPRRIWDLYANRVVPYWVAPKDWHAISHAWVDVKERVDVWTPINGYEWPVPVPEDTNLKLIRTEMLNLGAEYVWLDVLCLRQEYAIREAHREEDLRKEDLRKEEWKLDVPTIGYVYDKKRKVVCYLSGLGRPLSFKEGDFESDRCWFNRAWTLQEIPNGSDLLIGGDTSDDRFMEEKMQTRIHEKLKSLRRVRSFATTFDIMLLMRNRVSTKPLDKVAGLTYLFNAESIPIYDGAQSEEDAWMALVDVMQSSKRAELFFYYPGPGNGNRSWRPSWEQAMSYTLPWCNMEHNTGYVRWIKETDSDWYNGPRIDTIYVYGLANPSDSPRQGKLLFEENTRGSCACKIVADHTYPIPNGWYTIISISEGFTLSDRIWVVGQLRRDGKFEKVSVISLADKEEKLKHWGLRVKRRVHTVLC
ncbi:uncharacterized protein EV420DRAFT_1314246 [Desarmillaria tabescens]|uniref:Heterokaryon incompatibility domain-containing protein n=1 Tax=Armillaria tabescens TaxID=1929756 RepID=A0AA39MSC3_ARMTA|nr:uncharacterized protein EV420DRAFT_1314246 [Desarmillaria tabescens]KAK0445306.1 hypothetical protein EV420DRAFT_1314246 [Desarmillaria tabescens]